MSQAAQTDRPEPCPTAAAGPFYAYATDEGPCAGRRIPDAGSFPEAAIGFLECWTPADGRAWGEICVSVIDCETGETQCFRIDIATGGVGRC